MKNIFDAARAGDISALKTHLAAQPDLSAKNEYGFTALHQAAMGTNSMAMETAVEVLKLLTDAGSPLEEKGNGGRTAIYLAAEFSPYVEPVQVLIDAGANPDVYDEHGNHIVENAKAEEVQELLSKLTGKAIPEEPEPGPEPVKMKSAAWKKAKADIDAVFEKLEQAGLIALQDAGYTQSDGFEDCVEAFHNRNGQHPVVGFCFYTRQDLDRAKKTSELPLGIWGAPEGSSESTVSVGKLVVETFQNSGFHVLWTGSASMRPSVYLHRYSVE